MAAITNLDADSLREQFNANFSYEDLNEADIVRLAMFVMQECAAHCLYGEHTRFWVPSLLPKHGVKVHMSETGGIESAFIRCNGTYFKDREAISFNGDDFIGFAGWADSKNVQPFYKAFQRWMNEKRFGTEYMRGAPNEPLLAASNAMAQVFAPAC